MAGIRTRDTKPEVTLRKALHTKGYRYRLHPKGLPGKPDFVLPRLRVAVFVHGCFWHFHECSLFKMPTTRHDFWQAKLSGNRDRDRRVAIEIGETEWRVLTVWECALRGPCRIGVDEVLARVEPWFNGDSKHLEIRGTG